MGLMTAWYLYLKVRSMRTFCDTVLLYIILYCFAYTRSVLCVLFCFVLFIFCLCFLHLLIYIKHLNDFFLNLFFISVFQIFSPKYLIPSTFTMSGALILAQNDLEEKVTTDTKTKDHNP